MCRRYRTASNIERLRSIFPNAPREWFKLFYHIKAYWVLLGEATAQTAIHFGANDLDGTITDGGELTHSYSVESGEVKMTKHEIIEMIGRAGFEAVERDTVYNRVAAV